MTNYEDFEAELLKDSEVKREYDSLELKYMLILLGLFIGKQAEKIDG